MNETTTPTQNPRAGFVAPPPAVAEQICRKLDVRGGGGHRRLRIATVEGDGAIARLIKEGFAATGEPAPELEVLALPGSAVPPGEGVREVALQDLAGPADRDLVVLAPPVDGTGQAIAAALGLVRPLGRMVVVLDRRCTVDAEGRALVERNLEPGGAATYEDEASGAVYRAYTLRLPEAMLEVPVPPPAPGESLEGRDTALEEVDPSLIDEDPGHNPRRTYDPAGIEALARNILELGCRLIQPIGLRPGENGRYLIVWGHRRVLAIRLLASRGRWPAGRGVRALVGEFNRSEARLVALVENNQRVDVDPVEEAEGYAGLWAEGHSVGSIAVKAGREARFVEQRLKLAFGLAPSAKALYRENRLTLEALKALTVAPPAEQSRYLERAGDGELEAGRIRAALRAGKLTMRHARFPLAAYRAAGGQAQEDLFSSAEGTVLEDRDLAVRLQEEWLETEKARLVAEGWAWANVVPPSYPFLAHRAGGAVGDGQSGVLLSLDPSSLEVTARAGIMPREEPAPAAPTSAPPSAAARPAPSEPAPAAPARQGGTTATIPLPPAPAAEPERGQYSAGAIEEFRRLRTMALQGAITDPKVGLALTILGQIGVGRVHLQVKQSNGNEAGAAPAWSARWAAWRERIARAATALGIEATALAGGKGDANAVDGFRLLMSLSLEQLLDLNTVLVARRVGDWIEHEPRDNPAVHPFVAHLAAHHGVRGHEAWTPDQSYLERLPKRRLEPYLAAAGVADPRAMANDTRKVIFAAVLERSERITGSGWCPPELDIAAHAPGVATPTAGPAPVVSEPDDLDDGDLEEDEGKALGQAAD